MSDEIPEIVLRRCGVHVLARVTEHCSAFHCVEIGSCALFGDNEFEKMVAARMKERPCECARFLGGSHRGLRSSVRVVATHELEVFPNFHLGTKEKLMV